MKSIREYINLIESAQTPPNTGYRLELLDQETQPDPEDYADMTVYYFDVYQGDKWVGRANGNDYFGELDVTIGDKAFTISSTDDNNPLMKQFRKYTWGDDDLAEDEASARMGLMSAMGSDNGSAADDRRVMAQQAVERLHNK